MTISATLYNFLETGVVLSENKPTINLNLQQSVNWLKKKEKEEKGRGLISVRKCPSQF